MQNNVQRPVGNEVLFDLGSFLLRFEDRVGVGADHRDIDQVDDDDGDDKRNHLVDEVEG